ncbi:hypothetical protein J2Y66_000684 [Paenarthrobacter nitroguajacolicus]|nr:hypothetical protein [Paenarthrobacter nitroguajacolicus]
MIEIRRLEAPTSLAAIIHPVVNGRVIACSLKTPLPTPAAA